MMEAIERDDVVTAKHSVYPSRLMTLGFASTRQGGVTMKRKGFRLWHARMILGGAIAGAALAGIVLTAFGVQPKESHDVIGALLGSSASAVLLKLAHLI